MVNDIIQVYKYLDKTRQYYPKPISKYDIPHRIFDTELGTPVNHGHQKVFFSIISLYLHLTDF